MASKKQYQKPELLVIVLDKSITLMMMTTVPPNPMMPRGGDSKGTDTPFTSPFDSKPFS